MTDAEPASLEGQLSPAGRYAIVVSRYNDHITGRLLESAQATLRDAGVAEHEVTVAWVPGAWELPLIAQDFAATQRFAAVLCLGCVIRGETTHDQYINQQVSHSLGRISMDYRTPVLFGLLTCQSLEQALQRAGGAHGNKGAECAEAALRMADLRRRLKPRLDALASG